uniref:carbonic anhydrase n=1 Tax=Odontella aurita TaxID=265563 RepID=A0A7S4MGE2_9STRA
MAVGATLLIVAIVTGVLVSQGKAPGSGGGRENGDSNANVALDGSGSVIPETSVTTTIATENSVTTPPGAEAGTTAAEEEETTSSTSGSSSQAASYTSTTRGTTTTKAVDDLSTNMANLDSSTSAAVESTEPVTTATTTAAEVKSTTTPEDESITPSSTTTTSTTVPTTTTTTTITTPPTTTTTTTTTTPTTTTTTTSTSTASTTTDPPLYFPSEPVPSSPPPGYFNYNVSDARYGPSSWGGSLLTPSTGLLSTPEYVYWSRYQDEVKRDLTVNMCGTGDTQSPIDVRMDIVRGYRVEDDGDIHLPESGEDLDMDGDTEEYEEGICYQHHEIRTSAGRTSLQSDAVVPQILPNKLRLVYDPYASSDADINATIAALPASDFPHGWGGRIDLKHVDVHVPSQHKVEGKEFPAEYQLWHLHPRRRRAAVVSIMVDVHPQGNTNHHFNKALAEWQKVWEDSFDGCRRRRRRRRMRRRRRAASGGEDSLDDDIDRHTGNPFGAPSTGRREEDDAEEETDAAPRTPEGRDLSSDSWNPYDKNEIMRSIHFYGYSGSLTEPPCSDFVEWHIMDKPMLVSPDQLRHLRYLLFLYRDPVSCERTGVHYEGAAARRPLRTVSDLEHGVHRCTCHDFLSDEVRRADVNVTRCTKTEEQDDLRESLDALLS